MKRILNVATTSLLTIFTLGGMYFPSSPVMLLASTNEQFTYIRLSIIIILMALLFYRPPRTVGFRVGLAAVAAVLGFSTISMISNYTLMPFDALLFIEVTLLLFIEAAELGVKKESSKVSAPTPKPRAKRTLRTA